MRDSFDRSSRPSSRFPRHARRMSKERAGTRKARSSSVWWTPAVQRALKHGSDTLHAGTTGDASSPVTQATASPMASGATSRPRAAARRLSWERSWPMALCCWPASGGPLSGTRSSKTPSPRAPRRLALLDASRRCGSACRVHSGVSSDLSGCPPRGKVNQKVEPCPGALSTPTCP